MSSTLSTVNTVNTLLPTQGYTRMFCRHCTFFSDRRLSKSSLFIHIFLVFIKSQRFSRESLLHSWMDEPCLYNPETQCSFWAMNLSPFIELWEFLDKSFQREVGKNLIPQKLGLIIQVAIFSLE